MQPQHNYTLRAVILSAFVALVAGCNTTNKTADAGEAKKAATEPKQAVAEQEYERTTSLGSWVPVKKKKKAAAPAAENGAQTVSPDSMDKLNEAGRTMGTRGLSPTN